MKDILIVLCALFVCKAKGQDSGYTIIDRSDSLFFMSDLDDGQYRIMEDDSTTQYLFHIKDKKVHGPFYAKYGFTHCYGFYFQDSLFTFYTNRRDSTYKSGFWKDVFPQVPTRSLYYPIRYDTEGTNFNQRVLGASGQKLIEFTFAKDKGVIDEKTFYDSGILETHIRTTEYQVIEEVYLESGELEYIEVSKPDFSASFDFHSDSEIDRMGVNYDYTRSRLDEDGQNVISGLDEDVGFWLDDTNRPTFIYDNYYGIQIYHMSEFSMISYPTARGKKRKRIKVKRKN